METTLLNSSGALLASFTSEETSRGPAPIFEQPVQAQPANADEGCVTLRPRPLAAFRKALVCGWSAFLIVSPWSPSFKLDCCLVSLVILGTFRTTTASRQRITWTYRFGFLPFYTRRLALRDQSCVATGWEERSGLAEAALLGLWSTVLAPLADWLCPWRGGPYRLWVMGSDGKQTLVWRGRVERTYHRNHRLLIDATGLPSRRAPASDSQPNWL